MTGETVILTPQSWHRGPAKEYGPTWVVAPCGTGCGNYAVVPAEGVERESVSAFRNPCGRCYPKHPYWRQRKRYEAVVARLHEGGGAAVIVEAESPADAFDRVCDLLPHGSPDHRASAPRWGISRYRIAHKGTLRAARAV